MKYVTLFALATILFTQTYATTIAPYQNLAEMAAASDAVVFAKAMRHYEVESNGWTRFRTQFQTVQIISGSVENNFDVQDMHLRSGDIERIVLGDVDFHVGESYLLFLDLDDNGMWRTLMLSHGVFQEFSENGIALLVPVDNELNFEVVANPGEGEAEPFYVYNRDLLLGMLTAASGDTRLWDSQKARTDMEKTHFHNKRAAPSHCTFLSGSSGPYAHWPNMSTTSLPMRYHQGGASGCSGLSSKMQSAVNLITSNYGGVNLVNAGTHNFNTSCDGNTAHGNDFVAYLNNNLGGSRNLVVQFDDPCNELPNLSGCSGVLAHGGFYWSSSQHQENGQSYKTALYGYVTVNNGVGGCYCGGNTFTDMMVHEITHALGLGHISASAGNANMNPSGPGEITNLDVQCLDWFYPPTGGSGGPCPPTETVVNEQITGTEDISASQQITLDNVQMTSNADVTLMAPTVLLLETQTINQGAELTIITQNGCN